MTTKVSALLLANTSVTAGTYGGSSQIPVITADAQGRLQFAGNATPSVANTQITGVMTGSQLANTSVTPGTYGGSTQHAVVVIDQQGRITSASNVAPSVANTQITGLITSSQIATVANTQITGTIPSSQVSGLPVSGIAFQAITTTGSTQTFTIPAGVTALKVTVVGGGGSGGQGNNTYTGSGNGGGGGGMAIKYLTGLTPGSTLSVVVGAGASGSSVTGGTSSVSSGTQSISTISATGGSGGASKPYSWSTNGGAGGVGSGGDFNLTGGYGSYAGASGACTNDSSGAGGSPTGNALPGTVIISSQQNPLGVGAVGPFGGKGGDGVSSNSNSNGNNATGYGCGGGGAVGGISSGSGVTGGSGSQGIVVFEW